MLGPRKDAGVTSTEREELTKFRREKHRLRQERDILAKALASNAVRPTARERTRNGSSGSWARYPGRPPDRHHGLRAGRLGVWLLRLAEPPCLCP